MTNSERREMAVKELLKVHGEHGEYPDHVGRHEIRKLMERLLGVIPTDAQITVILATCQDVATATGAAHTYHGQTLETGDELYEDALNEYLDDKHATLYRLAATIRNSKGNRK